MTTLDRDRRPSRWFVAAAIAVAVVAGVGVSSGSAATPRTAGDARASSRGDFAGLVGIGGGRKVYLECRGTGSPTVVLVSGYGDTGRIWSADVEGAPRPHVLPAVAGFTRVCAYDRPGTIGVDTKDPALRSRSDRVPQPRAAEDTVADLHALLRAAKVPGPYVLVGHSLGGAYVRLYAATYPDDPIAGMVLVDATNEYFRAALTPADWEVSAETSGVPPPGAEYPGVERADFTAVLDALERAVAAQPLHELPLVVLARGREDDLPPEFAATLPPGWHDRAVSAWRTSQAQLALVPDARQIIATDSGHYIQLEQPALVIEAIRQVVEGVRHPNTWSDLVACCAR